jgi:hypothetical protein
MAEFTLDTSGVVTYFDRTTHHTLSVQWSDLSPFAQGYIEALFESLEHPGFIDVEPGNNDAGHIPVGFRHLAGSTLAAILKDCERFQASEMAELCNAAEGAWLWRTRQSGLSAELSEDYPPRTPSLGDDGKVYLAVSA